uniref:Homeobox domain-containing protein n=1 Tax=Angiostrongylus cantonensis TaxID=6313 RepID=A0A0K0D9A9_ANGCA
MESGHYTYPAGTIFEELSWMPMPPTYYAYPMSASGQAGYPVAMQHALPYPSMANWCSYNANGECSNHKPLNTYAILDKIQEKTEFVYEATAQYAAEKVKIWFQNQRYKRKHRESSVPGHTTVTSSSGANTSVSSVSSSSPTDSPDSANSKHNGITETTAVRQGSIVHPGNEMAFQHSNYPKLYWESQATYYPCPNFAQEYIPNAEGKLSLPICTEDDLEL